MHPRPGDQAVGHRVANAAAEGVHHVFFRMAVGWEIDPLATAALAGVVSKCVLQLRAARMDLQVAGFEQVFDRVEPVQNQVLRPTGDDSRAELSLVFRIGRRSE
jgi:hypothetical protein